MNKRLVFLFTIVTLKLKAMYCHSSCDSRCPDTNGYVLNCALNKPSHLLDQKHAISQLQCFDYCLRQQHCHVYNFKKESSYCELFGGLWSFEDEKSLVAENSTVFSWLGRDQYTLVSKTIFLRKLKVRVGVYRNCFDDMHIFKRQSFVLIWMSIGIKYTQETKMFKVN